MRPQVVHAEQGEASAVALAQHAAVVDEQASRPAARRCVDHVARARVVVVVAQARQDAVGRARCRRACARRAARTSTRGRPGRRSTTSRSGLAARTRESPSSSSRSPTYMPVWMSLTCTMRTRRARAAGPGCARPPRASRRRSRPRAMPQPIIEPVAPSSAAPLAPSTTWRRVSAGRRRVGLASARESRAARPTTRGA